MKVPIWLVINTKENGIDWNEDIFSIHIHAPFDLQHSEDFDSFAINLTITMNELTLNAKDNHIGINLDLLKHRLYEYEVDCTDIDNFIIQIADIEEVLNFHIGD
ncbi:hypothetical protein CHH83_01230 [Bacillus sp. 7586-K]|nr:hypothetical protein CHH83_01230 [Bacillus sp. 7586-K]